MCKGKVKSEVNVGLMFVSEMRIIRGRRVKKIIMKELRWGQVRKGEVR